MTQQQPFSLNFTSEKVNTGTGNLVPTGTLAWGVLSVKGMKHGDETGGQFADCELTLLGGSYEGRKMFPMISNPFDMRNKEGGRQMGFAAVLHMVEAANLVNFNDPASYAPLSALAETCKPENGGGVQQQQDAFVKIMTALDGKAVAVKIGIRKDKNGAYPDRNQVSEWLSPNPTRSTHKGYQALAEGRESMKPVVPGVAPGAAAPAAGGAFGTTAPVVVAAPAFAQPAAQPAALAQPAAPLAQPATPPVGPGAAAPAFLTGGGLTANPQSGQPATVRAPF